MTDINKKDAKDIQQGPIPETITFHTADRMTYGALGYDGNELMAFISACADALAQVFYEALMEQLINEKADFVKPHHWKPATLSEKEGNEIRQDNGHAG